MTNTKLRPSFTFTEERLAQLREIVPEAFGDGRVNWEALREVLGDWVESEEAGAEHFGLTWPGKRGARRLAALPSQGTLVPAPGEGVDEDTTKNIFIEGDNLEVLKLLQKSYAGRVKMIYIDPPYNTGNDFVYKDDFSEPIESYFRKTGQIDNDGVATSTNTKSDGRFHSNWLSMIYPRLLVARRLLAEDGVIFVSIDDNEVANLRTVMNEIFGEENFIAQISAQLNPRGRHLDRFVARTHEYLIIYASDATEQPLYQLEKDERMAKEYNKTDQNGAFRELELRNRNPAFNSKTRPNLFFPVFVSVEEGTVRLERDTTHRVEVLPLNSEGADSCWTWGKDRVRRENHLLAARQVQGGGWRIFRKDYLIREDGARAGTLPKSLWLDKEFNNDYGKKALQKLFSGSTPFDFPKSVEFISRMLKLGAGDDGLILDFFAGSCATAEAAVRRNVLEGTHNPYIMIQIPDPVKADSTAVSAGFRTLAEVGEERLRRLRKDMRGHLNKNADVGFRLFKLDRSNFRAWQDYNGSDIDALESLFSEAETPLVSGWTANRLLPEVMLLEGFPLDSTTAEKRPERRQRVFFVESPHVAHRLVACFDEKIDAKIIEDLELSEEDVFVCLDSALTDRAKIRLSDRGTLRTI